ncbi:MAG TPA: histidine phosphatase family protein [Propionibacteriaceae bacterium]|jgi:broad specificity phosphatase PhoE|nr:histidine phosphatase family protein [Propionibacteriaceae bacterium]
MTAARIIIWRHGRTEWNVVARFQGQADVPLDEVGYTQAARAADVLAAYRPTGLYSSDLSRSYQTAAMLAERTGLEITTDKRLREIHVGSWEGLVGKEIRAANPDLARRLWAGEDVRRSPTGESPSEVAERMAEALTEIADAAEDHSTVVVVTHGLAGRVGACRFVGLPFEHWRLFGGLSNCAWVSIDRHRSGAYWRIEGYNVTADSDLEIR